MGKYKRVLQVLVIGLLLHLGMATNAISGLIGLFPNQLLDNSTVFSDSTFLGPPDDTYGGIGGQIVTYDFGLNLVIDGPGQDFNVYEVDGGIVEFGSIDVFVSANGVDFFLVDSTMQAKIDLDNDNLHNNASFAKSYDLGPSGLSSVRYIRIDGVGTGASGGNTAFDLDALGAINYSLVPAPAGLLLLGSGLTVLAGLRRKFKK